MEVSGQNYNPVKEKIILIERLEFNLDSFSIIPNSLKIFSKDSTLINKTSYLINEIDAKIKISDTTLFGGILTFQYSVYPVLLSKSFYHRKLTFTEPENNANSYWKKDKSFKINTNNSDLTREGNISRNIMMGNAQDLSILSNIDLRISGTLSQNLQIQSVISDNNLPFQEDGSSYKLQEFDKVYIRIFNEENEIITGDIFTQNNSRFLKFKRKAKGIILNNSRKWNKFTYTNSSSVSMSKGKYANNSFQGTEGNQGPYKLKGNNGENYIIVLSGTEKVYMDGEILERGIDKDYIIDYNSSEIIFTNKHLITKDKRIYIEFEYNDKSYAQSIITSNQNINNDKLDFSFFLYSETDWKNQNYLTELSDTDKQTLSENGDTEIDIFSSSIDSVTFSEERILYQKVDTLINGNPILFYRFSSHPDSSIYQIKFTEVNQNEGHYILKEEGINGKIYKWIPPIFSGEIIVPQGNYTPNIRIIAPKSKTIISSELHYIISDRLEIQTNATLENSDENLFSDLDDENNNSLSSYFEIKYKLINSKTWQLITRNSLELIAENYTGINKYREIEFGRNWNIINVDGNQLLQKNELILLKKNTELLKYQYQNLKIGEHYSGFRNSLVLNYKKDKVRLKSDGKLSVIKINDYSSSLLFYNSNLNYKMKYFDVDISFNIEDIMNINNDETLENSKSFTELSSKLKNEIIEIELVKRNDSKISDFSKSDQININIKLYKNRNLKYNSSIIYRNLNYMSDSLTDENNLLSDNKLQVNLWNDFVKIEGKYELGKGKQAKKEKSFIKVPAGLGTHNWIDQNSNGIQELNEFVISLFQDEAEYVSLLLPSSQLENMYILNYNQHISVDLKKISKNKFIRRFYFSNNYQIQNKNKVFNINPYSENSLDSSISYLFQDIKSASFNRNNKKFSLQIYNKTSIIQNSFSYGTDQQIISENKVRCSSLLWGRIKNNIHFTSGNKENISSFFENKNYAYTYKKIEENIKIKKGGNSSLNIHYIYQNKEILQSDDGIISNEIGLSIQQIQNEKYSFESSFKFINIQSTLSANSILTYELMEGLMGGNNLVWGIKYGTKLKNNLQVDLQYNGRKSENSNIKHVGNMGITAYF